MELAADPEVRPASAWSEEALWRRAEVRVVDGSVLPWLLVTATNLSRNTARGTRRHRKVLERLPRPSEQPDVAEVALDGAPGVDARLRTGLLTLSRTDAHLFVLIALEGFPVAAAAQQLQLTESAARARLHRIRTTLRAGLDERTPEGDLRQTR